MSDQQKPTHGFASSIEAYQRAVERNDNEAASDAMHDLFAAAAKVTMDNPDLTTKLLLTAKDLESKGEWEAAIDVYQNILSIADLDALTEMQAHENLGIISRWMNRDSESLEHRRRATASARRSESAIILSICLQREAGCMIRCGQIDDAISRLDEALSVLDDGPMYDTQRANALTGQAMCAVKKGSLTAADLYLEEAFHLLKPSAKITIAAGVQGNLAYWWSVRAQLQTAQQDNAESLSSWRKAVETMRQIAALPHVEPSKANSALADMLKGLARALTAANLEEEMNAALEERRKALDAVGLPNYQSK